MAKAKNTPAADDVFTVAGKSYKMLLQKVHIPEIGIRTAAEVLVDPDAQRKLVEIGCVGTVIEEVI